MNAHIFEHTLTDGSIVYGVRLTQGEREILLDCRDKNDAEVLQLHLEARVVDFSTRN